MNVPKGSNVFSDPVGVCQLELRQLRVLVEIPPPVYGTAYKCDAAGGKDAKQRWKFSEFIGRGSSSCVKGVVPL